MSYTNRSRRNQSPIKWRAGENDDSSNASNTWVSQDSPDSLAYRDGGGAERYDAEEIRLSDIPVKKHLKFDELLKRIEAERQKMTSTSDNGGTQRLDNFASLGRAEERENSPSAPSDDLDYASRARELRMSLGAPLRPTSAKRSEKDRDSSRARIRELRTSLDDAPAGRSRTPHPKEPDGRDRAQRQKSIKSLDIVPLDGATGRSEGRERARELRMSLDGGRERSGSVSRREHKERAHRQKSSTSFDTAPTHTPPRSKSTSRSGRNYPSQRARHTPPRQSTGKKLIRSTSEAGTPLTPPMRMPSPSPSQEDFKLKVEKFHSSLILAHDTIANLERDVKSLKSCITSLEEKNRLLEEKNQVLNETLAKNRDEVVKIKEESDTIVGDRNAIVQKQNEEMKKLRSECSRYKTYARDMEKLSSDRDGGVREMQREKQDLEDCVDDKDETIENLRSEIRRLNDELADGAIVKSNALKADETVRKLSAELEKSKRKQAPNNDGTTMKVMVDLNQANMTITRMV